MGRTARRPLARVLADMADRHRGAVQLTALAVLIVGGAGWHWHTWLPLVFLAGALAAEAGRLAAEAWGWQRAGGKAELRRLRRHGGPATMRELHRHLSLRAARRAARAARPSLAGLRLAAVPAHQAGIALGTARRSAR
jgi:hypothetical protein